MKKVAVALCLGVLAASPANTSIGEADAKGRQCWNEARSVLGPTRCFVTYIAKAPDLSTERFKRYQMCMARAN